MYRPPPCHRGATQFSAHSNLTPIALQEYPAFLRSPRTGTSLSTQYSEHLQLESEWFQGQLGRLRQPPAISRLTPGTNRQNSKTHRVPVHMDAKRLLRRLVLLPPGRWVLLIYTHLYGLYMGAPPPGGGGGGGLLTRCISHKNLTPGASIAKLVGHAGLKVLQLINLRLLVKHLESGRKAYGLWRGSKPAPIRDSFCRLYAKPVHIPRARIQFAGTLRLQFQLLWNLLTDVESFGKG